MHNPFEVLENKMNSQEKLLSDILDTISKPKTENETKFLTREDVSDLLKINISSVFNWQKKGILKGYQFEGSSRIYYKLHEIEEAMIELKK